jgi:ribosomal protein S18 acetylase RimI-like enzyme
MTISVRRALSDDWQTLRDIRLAALQESPSAFGSTYARESAWPEAKWRDWTAESEKATDQILFLAFDGDQCVGIAGGYDNEGKTARVIAMWVSPAARGRGIGELLVNAVVDWARSIGREVVDLHVTVGNTAAERLYRRLGFIPTGRGEPLPSDASYMLDHMELRLDSTG